MINMVRVRGKYGRFCAKDINEVRQTVKNAVRKAAEEWAKKSALEKGPKGERGRTWRNFLKQVLSEELSKVGAKCVPR